MTGGRGRTAGPLATAWCLGAAGVATVCSLAFAVPAGAQTLAPTPSDTFTVRGEVLDGPSGHPLSGVLVTLHDVWKVTRTDELGYFEIPGVPVGPHELGVYGLGYVTYEDYIDFGPHEILAVKLDPAPVEIEGVEVAILSNSVREYRSFGTRYDFIGPELMVEYRRKYGQITDMLRARFPGIRVVDTGTPGDGICVVSTRASSSYLDLAAGPNCAYMVIDGLEADPAQVAELHPEEIASIRYLSRLEALLVYGDLGRYGVLLVETVTAKSRR